MAKSGTIWVKILPMPRHGELFSKVVLWPTLNGGSCLPCHKNDHQRWKSDHTFGVNAAPARGLLQGLRCRGYAARAMLYGATPRGLGCRNDGSWLMMMMDGDDHHHDADENDDEAFAADARS